MSNMILSNNTPNGCADSVLMSNLAAGGWTGVVWVVGGFGFATFFGGGGAVD